MRILVFGGDGMLGHEVVDRLAATHEVRATLRRPLDEYRALGRFDEANAYAGVDVRSLDAVARVLEDFRPDAVVNAAAIIRQRPEAADVAMSIEVNALFPHRLAALAREHGSRLVQMSTDCVFSGRAGLYREDDLADPVDVYGRTKLLGEVTDDSALTIRTSLIGLELTRRLSLVEWAIAQRGSIEGFTRVPYSGLTTMAFARLLEWLLTEQPELTGLWHVAATPLSKAELLTRLYQALGRDVDVRPSEEFVCDRTLCADAFVAATGWVAPTWDEMLTELADRIDARERAAA